MAPRKKVSMLHGAGLSLLPCIPLRLRSVRGASALLSIRGETPPAPPAAATGRATWRPEPCRAASPALRRLPPAFCPRPPPSRTPATSAAGPARGCAASAPWSSCRTSSSFVVGVSLVGLLDVGTGGGELRKVDLGIGPAGRLRLPGVAAEMIADLVPRDRPQPVAERVAGPVLVKRLDVRRHRLEDLLKNVRHVLLGQAHRPAPVVDQRRIQRRQPLPRRRLTVLQLHQQAARRRGLGAGLASAGDRRPYHHPVGRTISAAPPGGRAEW